MMQPEIPQNVGTISRLAAATMCRLHIVRPTAFSLDDRNLRRPGLDYWPFVDLEIHDAIEPLIERCGGRVAFFSKYGTRPYTAAPTDTELLIFGRETSGLPETLWQRYPEHFYVIPMFHPGVRSLNVANAVSIVVYDQLNRRGLFASEGEHDQDSSATPRNDLGVELLPTGLKKGPSLWHRPHKDPH
jgi:tRNA (cytidine/uridine-2'-O-)-methyltransferase